LASHVPAPSKLVVPFLKALGLFFRKHGISQRKQQAKVCGVTEMTLRDWLTGKRAPTLETIQLVSRDLAAIERAWAVFPPNP
jgi:transcriptional regulator with XRE-family HTH domain